jgi:hypothetical protein
MPIIKPKQVITEDISKFELEVDPSAVFSFDIFLKYPPAKHMAKMCKFSTTSDKFIIYHTQLEIFKNKTGPAVAHAYYPFELAYYFYKNMLPVMLSIDNSTKQVTMKVCDQNHEIEKYLTPDCLDFGLCDVISPSHEKFGTISITFQRNLDAFSRLINNKVCAYIGSGNCVILKDSLISLFESKTPEELYKIGIIVGTMKYDSRIKFTISNITTPDLAQMVKNQWNKYQS